MMLKAEPGQTIDEFSAEMIVAAWFADNTVFGEFNQHKLQARPGMIRQDIIEQWDDSVKRCGGLV